MDSSHNKINLEVSVKINLVQVDNKEDLVQDLVHKVKDNKEDLVDSVDKVKDNKEDLVDKVKDNKEDLVDKVKDNKEDSVVDSVDKVKFNKEDSVVDSVVVLVVKYQEFLQFNLFKDLYIYWDLLHQLKKN